jgi:uncharacterized protein
MLSLDLNRIRTAHERLEEVYPPDTLHLEAGAFRLTSPVSFETDVYKDKDQYRLEGTVRATLELACSRCLEPFAWPVDASFDLRYQPATSNQGVGEHEIGEDDLATAFYENNAIDLRALMEEQFYLSLPMKPLCTETCKGLCPTCGANWNRAPCACSNRWHDPRLAGLRSLTRDS